MERPKYWILSKQVYSVDHYHIACISPEYIQTIRKWRNANMNILRQNKEVAASQQAEYFATKVFPLFGQQEPEQILFDFFLHNEFIGYGGLVHISYLDKTGEISFLLNPTIRSDKYEEAFLKFLFLMDKVGFEEVGLNKLYAETYQTRLEHVSILEKAGYRREGRLRLHKFINDNFADVYFHGKLKAER